MANLPFEYNFLIFRTIRPLLVLIRVYPCVSAADFSFCTNLPWRDLACRPATLTANETSQCNTGQCKPYPHRRQTSPAHRPGNLRLSTGSTAMIDWELKDA